VALTARRDNEIAFSGRRKRCGFRASPLAAGPRCSASLEEAVQCELAKRATASCLPDAPTRF